MDPDLKMLFQQLHKRMDRFEEKLDSVVRFKWQVLGGGAVLVFLISYLK